MDVSQIVTVKAAGNYVELHCDDGVYLKRTTLKQLLSELPHPLFVQVHRSYVINTAKLQKLRHLPNGGGIATLTNQQTVAVSKRCKADLKNLSLVSR